MFRNIFTAVASLAILVTAGLAQRGSVVSVDTENRQITVKVGEADYEVDAGKVELLDVDGKAAELSDFRAKDKVMVTMTDQKITSIQKLGSDVMMTCQDPSKGKVVGIDVEDKVLKVEVGQAEYTTTAKTRLLDKDGKTAKLADFTAGDKVLVTVVEGAVTVVQQQ